jgi:peptidoglycan/LPS O-acetylase OafA/YrhL
MTKARPADLPLKRSGGTNPGYVPELDGVRGLAILGVMALHFVGEIPAVNGAERLIGKVAGYGLWGVDLFFVLSGFLITGILLETKGRAGYFRNFYIRRTLRIFPLYYGVLLLLFVAIPAGLWARFDPRFLEARDLQAWIWPYLTNYYIGSQHLFSIPYVSHFWSLAVEEHFYLLWPVVILLLSPKAALRATILFSLTALALRISFASMAPDLLYANVLTPCRLDALCIGAWFALAARQPGLLAPARGILGMGLAAAAVIGVSVWHVIMPSADSVALQLRTTFVALFCGFFVYVAALHNGATTMRSALRMSWLRSLGKYSYGLYVFHGLVSYAFGTYQPYVLLANVLPMHTAAAAAQIALGVGLSLAMAVASYQLFERRFLALKDRFGPATARERSTASRVQAVEMVQAATR